METSNHTPSPEPLPRVFLLLRNGKPVCRGPMSRLAEYIHKNHSFSLEWATTNEGYTIEDPPAQYWMDVVDRVCSEHQARFINRADGRMCAKRHKGSVLLDAVTASMLQTVDRGVKDPTFRAVFRSLPLMQAVNVGWKMVK